MTSAPPNWYPDPHVPGRMRYWDGTSGPPTSPPPSRRRSRCRRIAAVADRLGMKPWELLLLAPAAAFALLMLIASAATSGFAEVLIMVGFLGLLAAVAQLVAKRVVRG